MHHTVRCMRKSKSKCTRCYGKGYSTRLWGGSVTTPDFYGDAPYRVPITLEIKFCRCRNGKAAAKRAGSIVSAERRRLKIIKHV